jgi:hypothetical protein
MKSIRYRIYKQSTSKHDRKPESVNTQNTLDLINRHRMIKIFNEMVGKYNKNRSEVRKEVVQE